jgi:DNA-binding protein
LKSKPKVNDYTGEMNMTEKTTKKRTTAKKKTDENTIFVGRKPTMSYVLAVVTQFNNNSSNEVVIKARGGAISTAVDTAEIVRNRFMKDIKVKEIIIGTEPVKNLEGRSSNVSSIEIYLETHKKSK